jgi:hypothetical protein
MTLFLANLLVVQLVHTYHEAHINMKAPEVRGVHQRGDVLHGIFLSDMRWNITDQVDITGFKSCWTCFICPAIDDRPWSILDEKMGYHPAKNVPRWAVKSPGLWTVGDVISVISIFGGNWRFMKILNQQEFHSGLALFVLWFWWFSGINLFFIPGRLKFSLSSSFFP